MPILCRICQVALVPRHLGIGETEIDAEHPTQIIGMEHLICQLSSTPRHQQIALSLDNLAVIPTTQALLSFRWLRVSRRQTSQVTT